MNSLQKMKTINNLSLIARLEEIEVIYENRTVYIFAAFTSGSVALPHSFVLVVENKRIH